MFEISEEMLEEYANLAVKVGANVQIGQTVNIACPVNAYKLARKCAEELMLRWIDEVKEGVAKVELIAVRHLVSIIRMLNFQNFLQLLSLMYPSRLMHLIWQ